MAATIKIKNSSTASAVPTSSDLVQGELAVNVTDKRIFTENASGTVVELGTNPSTLTVAAGATIQGLTVGRGAGSVSTNTAVGASALGGASNSGNHLAAFGKDALGANSSGVRSVAAGSAALSANTTGSYNVGVGTYDAGGAATLASNTTGSNLVAVGIGALASNTTASNNTAVGYQAGYANTTGASNAFIGYQAGTANTTGSQNSYLGYFAGGAMTTGSSNTIVGRFTGNQGGLDIRTASNYIVLSDGDGNPRLWVGPNGEVISGAGTASSWASGAGSYNAKTTNANLQCFTAWNATDSGTRYFAYFGVGSSSFSNVGAITSTGTTTSYVTSSDYRLKENVQPMTGALATVALLKPCTYTWKADGSAGQGFIAHELQEVVPDAVNGEKDAVNEDGSIKPQGIDTSFLVATLTAAIQELNAQQAALKAEFDAYKEAHP